MHAPFFSARHVPWLVLGLFAPGYGAAQEIQCELANNLASAYYKRIYEAAKRDDKAAAWEGSRYFWTLHTQAPSCKTVAMAASQLEIMRYSPASERPGSKESLMSLIARGDLPPCTTGACNYTVQMGGTAATAGRVIDNYLLKFDTDDKTPSVWTKQKMTTFKIEPGDVLAIDPQKVQDLKGGLQVVPKEGALQDLQKNHGPSASGLGMRQ